MGQRSRLRQLANQGQTSDYEYEGFVRVLNYPSGPVLEVYGFFNNGDTVDIELTLGEASDTISWTNSNSTPTSSELAATEITALVNASTIEGLTASSRTGSNLVNVETQGVSVAAITDGVAPSNTPPSIDAITDVNTREGDSATRAISASDPESDNITIGGLDVTSVPATSLPAWAVLTVDAQSGTTRTADIDIDPTAATAGTYVFQIKASNVSGEDNATFTCVVAANTAPILTPISDINITETQSSAVDIVATDADGDALTVTATLANDNPLPSWAVLTNLLNYDGQTGNFTSGLTVTGGTSGATGVIVTDTDLGATGLLTLKSVSGLFEDDEALTDTSTGVAVVNGIVSQWNIALDPGVGDAGTVSMKVNVTDGTNTPATDTFDVVVGTNTAPVVAAIDDQIVLVGTALNVSANATDADGDTLTMTLTGSPPAWLTIVDNGGGSATITANPPAGTTPGTTNVTVRATDDGSGTLYDEVSFDVVATQSVVIQESGGLVCVECESALTNSSSTSYDAFTPTVDANASGGYTMAVDNVPSTNSTPPDAPYMEWDVNFTTTGNYYCRVNALSDSGGFDSWHWEIDGTTETETFSDLTEDGSLYWAKLTNDDAINVATTGEKTVRLYRREANMEFDKLVLTTDQSLFLADDGPAISSYVLSGANNAPVITAITDKSVAEQGTLDVSISVSDADSDAITITAALVSEQDPDATSPLLAWMPLTLDTQSGTTRTGQFDIDPPAGASGQYNIRVTAGDGELEDTEDFVVDVTANTAPALAAIGPVTYLGSTLNIPISATDPEGDNLAFSVNTNPTWVSIIDNGNGTGTLRIDPDVSVIAGDYFATVVVTDDGVGTLTDQEIVTITISTAGAFQQDGSSNVVMEAENFATNVAGASWGPYATTVDALASNGFRMDSNDTILSSSTSANGPRMTYVVNVPSGTWDLWLREVEDNVGDEGANSVFYSLGDSGFIESHFEASSTSLRWSRMQNLGRTAKVSATTTTVGDQTLTIVRREKYVNIDQIVLTQDDAYAPVGAQTESSRTPSPPGNSAPVITGIGDVAIQEDQSQVVSITATDAQGDTITLSCTVDAADISTVAWASLTDNADGTGTIDLDPTSVPSTNATYAFVVTATDDGDPVLAGTEAFSVVVSNASVATYEHELTFEQANGSYPDRNGNVIWDYITQGSRDGADTAAERGAHAQSTKTGTVTISTDQAYEGTKSLKCTQVGAGGDGRAELQFAANSGEGVQRFMKTREEWWIGFALYNTLTTASTWELYLQAIRGGGTEQPGYGGTGNPCFLMGRSSSGNSLYAMEYRWNEPAGARFKVANAQPFTAYFNQWQRFVVQLRDAPYGQTPGSPEAADGFMRVWTAIGTDPLQQVVDIGPTRWGWTHRDTEGDKQMIKFGIYGGNSGTRTVYLDKIRHGVGTGFTATDLDPMT